MALEIKKILFPTDLSKYARNAFTHAANIAGRYGASISILHVIEDIPTKADRRIAEFIGKEKYEEIKKAHEEKTREALIGKKREGMMIRQALDSFCRDFKADDPECSFVTDEIVVKPGKPVEEIIKQAETSGCDMIVMGYHERNMLATAVVGGVTRKVLRRSKKPVLLVPLTEDD